MELAPVDIGIFVVFVIAVVAVGLWKSRHGQDSEDYFLAGRGLGWVLIGFSLIAANISAEQFVGMSGQAAKDSIGLAVASYEWIAAVTLVVVAFLFLPKFLRSGIFTIPEYLEYRYNHAARTIMSLLMVVIYVGVNIATVIFLGAKALDPLFADLGITELAWLVGAAAATYVAAGGLKACAWADLIQGSALILGGAVIMVLAFLALDDPGSFAGIDSRAVLDSLGLAGDASFGEKFARLKETKMHMVLPRSSDFLPWTALLLGIWIPNFYYWGLNQYIMQRTLGASSLAHGQKGVVFAAFLKLLIPFFVCIPGIIAFTLYGPRMQENAMTDAQLNRPVLERFEEAAGDPRGARKVFPFDADFAALHPELAARILAFNARVLGAEIPEGAGPETVRGRAVSLLAARGADLEDNSENAPSSLEELNERIVALATSDSSPSGTDLAKEQTLVGYDYDGAFPLLIRYLTPPGLRGLVLAALMGAVVSTLASMLNAASTIFTMDIYREWIDRGASQRTLVWVGRACVPVCVVTGCLIAPQLADPRFQGAFAYIQEFQGYVSPGVLTIFLFGLFIPRSPRHCGVLGLVLSPIIYGALHLFFPDLAFLNRMALTVAAIASVLALVTVFQSLPAAVTLPEQTRISMEPSKGARTFGLLVVILTAALYVIFW